MWQNRGRDTDVVIDNLLLGKSCSGVQDFFQIRQLELLALNLNARIHGACAPAGIVPQTSAIAKYCCIPTQFLP
jgi:hypothetical protein